MAGNPMKYIILGGGIAALSAAIAIRKLDKEASIHMVSAENLAPYSRTMFSKAPLRGFDMSNYSIYPAQWYTNNKIRLHLGTVVEELDVQSKRVIVSSGTPMAYDKCIYALGAESFVPPIPGAEKDGVVTIRHSTDLATLRKHIPGAHTAAVIGGGVIGLEMAWELKRAGLDVTVLELADTLMERILDKVTAQRLEDAVVQAGIAVMAGVRIAGIEGEPAAERVVLVDGTAIPADIVILSTGVRANTAVAHTAGIAVSRAVVVDAYMRTNVEDVYACGDCAEFEGVNAATWIESQSQGICAGYNAADIPTRYLPEAGALLMYIAGIPLFSMGDMGKGRDVPYEIYERPLQPQKDCFRVNPRAVNTQPIARFYAVEGRLTGAALLGELSGMQRVKEAVQTGMRVDCFFQNDPGVREVFR